MIPRCFVIGHPIAHSRSPLIHGAWLAEHGLDGAYDRIDVAPAGLAAFVARIRAGEFAGGNVTVPHKEAVLPLLDETSEAARAMGAANTLWLEDGRLCGDNTDAAGFLGHLDASAPGWDARVRTALLLGAGGAARAIAHGLKGRGVARIVLANRNRTRAQELAASLGAPLEAAEWSARHGLVPAADLIVNTTSLGMKGQPPLDLDLSGLKPGAIVDDIVYVPLKTALLVEAERRGATIVDGLGMLLHQAVPGFARWFGVTPSVTASLRARLEADILGT
jgi:shikimate dehydrogenase